MLDRQILMGLKVVRLVGRFMIMDYESKELS